MQKDLSTDASTISASLSFIPRRFCFSTTDLGPLSDRYGRLVIFAIGCLVCVGSKAQQAILVLTLYSSGGCVFSSRNSRQALSIFAEFCLSITLLLMIPTLRLKNRHNSLGLNLAIKKSASYRYSLLVFIAPFRDRLSYVPQTIAFFESGVMAAVVPYKKIGQGKQLLPWLLALFSISTAAKHGQVAISGAANLTLLLIPFCMMAMANGAIYPILWHQHCHHFHTPQVKSRSFAKTPYTVRPVFPRQIV
ncbi:unnamed protein product, partial [Ranitomeya imitator]